MDVTEVPGIIELKWDYSSCMLCLGLGCLRVCSKSRLIFINYSKTSLPHFSISLTSIVGTGIRGGSCANCNKQNSCVVVLEISKAKIQNSPESERNNKHTHWFPTDYFAFTAHISSLQYFYSCPLLPQMEVWCFTKGCLDCREPIGFLVSSPGYT